jgi:hypothetical protein
MNKEDDRFRLGANSELSRRLSQFREFIAIVLHSAEVPLFVADDATIHDIYLGDEQELVARCERHYGVRFRQEWLLRPLWQVLDELEETRTA